MNARRHTNWTAAALALFLAAGAARGGEARKHFAEGEALHAQGEDAKAAEEFWRAAELAAGESLDPDVARYNALAAAANAEVEPPEEALSDGVKSLDVELQAALYFNRGNVWLARADKAGPQALEAAMAPGGGGGAEDGPAGPSELKLLERAVGEFREAVLRAPGVTAYRQNYEIAEKRRQEAEKREQQQQQQQQEQQQEQQEQEQEQEEGDPQEQQPQENGDGESQENGESGQQSQEGEQGEDGEPKQQESSGNDSGADGETEECEAGEAEEPESMTEEEAARLLDKMRDREERQRDAIRGRLGGRPVPVEKDW